MTDATSARSGAPLTGSQNFQGRLASTLPSAASAAASASVRESKASPPSGAASTLASNDSCRASSLVPQAFANPATAQIVATVGTTRIQQIYYVPASCAPSI